MNVGASANVSGTRNGGKAKKSQNTDFEVRCRNCFHLDITKIKIHSNSCHIFGFLLLIHLLFNILVV